MLKTQDAADVEENAMLNKVVLLLFLDQNVFLMLQNILTNPLVSHGLC